MIDCFRMLHEMQLAGVNNSQVAKKLGLYPSAIQHWKAGDTVPRADHALRFIMLYCETVKPTEIQLIASTHAYKVIVTPAMV